MSNGLEQRILPQAKASGSAVDHLIASIRNYIEVNDLRVGDFLPTELELAKQFNTSRNTVREAMRTLRAYGVVETRQKVGAVLIDNRREAMMQLYSFGHQISPEIFLDTQEFRRLIEEGACDAIFERANARSLATLEALNEALRVEQDISVAAKLDYAFHHQLVTIAANRTAIEIYDGMHEVFVKIMETGKRVRFHREDIVGEHADIISAIREKDRSAYVYWIRLHLKICLPYIVEAETSEVETKLFDEKSRS